MSDRIVFGVIAGCMLLSALLVVTARNLVHAVLWLAITLSMTAALFVTLQAPFIAGMQILLYTGGVITLMLFGIMLTRKHEHVDIEAESSPKRRAPAFIAAAALFGVVTTAIARTPDLGDTTGVPASTADIGRSFLTDNVLAFEILSVLLLAAMVGAIVLARRRDAGFDEIRIPGKERR